VLLAGIGRVQAAQRQSRRRVDEDNRCSAMRSRGDVQFIDVWERRGASQVPGLGPLGPFVCALYGTCICPEGIFSTKSCIPPRHLPGRLASQSYHGSSTRDRQSP
jgi:hypothetical protein